MEQHLIADDESAVRAARRRDRRIGIASVATALIVWAIVTNIGLVSHNTLPTPQKFAATLAGFVQHGYSGKSFLVNVGDSVFRAMTGLFFGILLGVPLGLFMGYDSRLNAALMPLIAFLRPIPALAFIPLVIIYFGIGELSKIIVIWIAAFLYMTLYASTGVRNVSREYFLLGLNLELSKWRMFKDIVFPAALPYIIAGIKTATALSWAIVVAAELIAAQAGLGYVIMDSSTFFNIPLVYVGIALIGAIGFALEMLTTLLERKILHWVGR